MRKLYLVRKRIIVDINEMGPKIPRHVKKIYLKYSYKFETLVFFEVVPLWLDTMISVPLLLLETLSKIFHGNAVKGCQWFSWYLCNVNKMPHIQNLIHPWEQKKVTRSQVRQLEGVGHKQYFVFSQQGGGLLTLQRFNKNCWWPVTAFPVKILDNVSSSGSGAEITASRQRGVLWGN